MTSLEESTYGKQMRQSSTDLPETLLPRSPLDRTYRGLLRALYEGRLVPGQRLVEPMLMEQFGVGRSTVREALMRLQSIGVVELIRHRGAVVRQLSRREVGDLLDLVSVLLGLAARRAAEHRDGGSLDEILPAMESALAENDFDAFVTAREAFYRAVVQRSDNRELSRLFPGALVRIMRLQLAPFGRAAEGLELTTYKTIAEAVRTGNGTGAEAAARSHVQKVQIEIDRLPNRAFRQVRSRP